MIAPPLRVSREGVIVEIHVTPSAGGDSVSYADGVVRVRTSEPADKGKANRGVLKALKPLFGECGLVRGHASKRKAVLVKNMGFDEVLGVLEGLGGGRRG